MLQQGPQNQDIVRRNPKDILWVHQTISPSFSQGAPNPKKKGENLPGEKVLKVASDIEKGKVSVDDFPPLKVFTITDADEGISTTYSLSNRRLTAFRAANTNLQIKTMPATMEDIYKSLWKMTSVTGGVNQPTMTLQANLLGTKESQPAEWTPLGKFKSYIERKAHKYEGQCDAQGIVGQQKEQTVVQGLARKARAKFNLA